jgi:Tfp pilus assembly protein PilO
MKKFHKSEDPSRQWQVPAVLLTAGLLIFLLSYSLLLPLRRQKQKLKESNDIVAANLQRQNYGGDESTLSRRKLAEEHLTRKLRDQWTQLTERLAAFPDQRELAKTQVDHIDFKVALYEVQKRLKWKSTSVAIGLPAHLGMDEEVDSEEDARELMLQLRAVEKIVDIALDLKIKDIRHVEPLPPLEYPARNGQDIYMEEYPVYISFHGDMNTIYEFFQSVLAEGNACVFRDLRIEKAKPDKESILEVDVVVSAILFPKSIDELGVQGVEKAQKILNVSGY